jgi:hypothetical protein
MVIHEYGTPFTYDNAAVLKILNAAAATTERPSLKGKAYTLT